MMLALRSLRARLLIIGIVPVVVALAVTAVLTVRSVDRFADDEREVKRAEQVRDLRQAATALSKLYGDRLQEAFLKNEVEGLNRDYLEEAYGGDLYYVEVIDSDNIDAESFGLQPLALGALPEGVVRRLLAGRSVELPAAALPPSLQDDVAVARGVFPAGQERPFGLLVVVQPPVKVTSPAGTLRRALVPAFAIGTGVAILLALVLGLRLVRPLRRLAAAARAVARGDEEVELDIQRADEIGMVNRAFDDMTHRLAEARDTERLFLMRVSHELRTPLAAIRSQVDALADGVFDDAETQAAAYAAITAESARLSRLVGDLLDLARLQARRFGLEADEVDLNVLLDQVVTGQGGEARERGIEMQLQAGRLPVVIGDGDRILQIVSNLVRNAVRWTPDDGCITVSALAEAGRVWITVDDSGPGIPADKRAAIFQAFYSEDVTGTGLGLAIARELALAMGGSVVVGESPHGGARFVVELPCVPAPSAAPVPG
jgi:signal transduction histidine kinase